MVIKVSRKKYVVSFGTIVLDDTKRSRRFITTCTILDEQHRVFTGAAVKASSDKFMNLEGQKVALRRAVGEIHSEVTSIGIKPWPRAWEEFRVAVLGAEPE